MLRTRRFLLPALVLVAIAAAIAWRLTQAAPSWYKPPDAGDPVVAHLADDVEYRIVEEVHRQRSEPFTIRLREEHANAWLAARLPRWIEGRGWNWPAAIGTPQIRLTSAGIDLAVDVETAAGRRYLVMSLQPRIDGTQIILSASGVAIGRMGLSRGSVDRLLDVLAPEKKAEWLESEFGILLVDALQGGAALEPAVSLADGRRLRVVGLTLNRGSVDVTLEAEDPAGE